jgi:predicted amidohydrolase
MRRGAFIAGIAALIVALYAGFLAWPAPVPSANTPIAAFNEFGAKSEASLIGVQPYLTPADYRSADALRARLGDYLEAAKERGWITERSVVVFPEHIGTWLAAQKAPAAAYTAKTTGGAMTALIAAHPFAFGAALLRSPEEDRAAAAIFRMRQNEMLAAYNDVFGGLAREFSVSIVAGSIVAENPRVENGRVVSGRGALYNSSVLFRPDGTAAEDIVLKAHPIPSETPFTAPAPATRIPTFATPAGRLGILICADSWHPDAYRTLKERGAELVAVPAFLQPDGAWGQPWRGYVTEWPDDVSRHDPGARTEEEAWLSYSAPARAPRIGVERAMTVFLRGRLWDLGADGRTLTLGGEGLALGDAVDGAALSVLWL